MEMEICGKELMCPVRVLVYATAIVDNPSPHVRYFYIERCLRGNLATKCYNTKEKKQKKARIRIS